MMKAIKKVVSISAIIIMLLAGKTYAESISDSLVMVEKSKDFEAWESLSKYDKENVIQPDYYNINIKDSIKRSVYNDLLLVGSNLESQYDLRSKMQIKVKNQQKVGACWAFSYTSMLETTLANKYNLTNIEYSPMHIDYMAAKIYNRTVGKSGTRNMSLAYATGGYGPVLEKDFPFESVYDEKNNRVTNYYLTDISNVNLNQKVRARVTDSTVFAKICKKYDTNSITYTDASQTPNEYSKEEVEIIRQLIKNQIKENGAVSATFYSDMGITANDEIVSSNGYYNSENKAFYCDDGDVSVNHAVTIIGWDDNYKRENFSKEHRPLNDGAYIVLNSWGETFGDNGYFYVSYDDSCIEKEVSAVNDIVNYEDELTENIYQYDELGVNMGYSLKDKSKNSLKTIEAANVFSRKDLNKKEYLTEVGIGLISTEGIEIYVNPKDDNLENANLLVATATGANALESGYHSLKLASPVELTGEKFVIKVKYINEEYAILPVEMNLKDNNQAFFANAYDTATSNEGESYTLFYGTTWTDFTKIFKNTNACIKGFTTTAGKPAIVNVEKIELNKTNDKVEVGKNIALVANITPENATNKNIIWTSSNVNVAKVENGVVAGLKAGNAIITATTEDGNKTAICSITVEDPIINVTGIKLSINQKTIKENEVFNLVATVMPENATNKKVIWTSSNVNVAKVENGVVTGLKAGIAVITATTEDGNKSITCNVNVEKEEVEEPTINVTNITLKSSDENIKIGDKITLQATVEPENATNKKVIWTSSNVNVAKVENGVVTGLKAGIAVITATTEDGNKTATCNIVVDNPTVNVTEVKISANQKTIKENETFKLNATVMPENATNKNVTWTSSNVSVATVNNGEVKGISKGTAQITVMTEDGSKKATCVVTVEKEKNEEVKVTGIELDKKELTMQVEDTTNLVATIKPNNSTNKEVKWETSNEKVAEVTEEGIITAVSEGTATIKVTTKDGNYIATCKITVTAKKNTADDIYKEQEPGQSTNKGEAPTISDTTISNDKIPFAGSTGKMIVGILTLILIIGIILKRNIDLKEIK